MANKLKIGFFALLLAAAPCVAKAQTVTGPWQIQNALHECSAAGNCATALGNLGGLSASGGTVSGNLTVSGQLLGVGSSVHMPTVATDALLKAYPLTGLSAGTQVEETGYYAAGDMPAVTYSLQTSACSAADGGSQIPSNTSGNCWLLNPQSSYDVRTWGAVAGGTDPNYTSGDTGNALAFNNMETYLQSLWNSLGVLQATDATGGGLTYGIDYPVNLTAKMSHQHDMNFVVLSAGVTANNFPCATEAAVIIGPPSSTRNFENIKVDLNRLAVNGVGQESTGTQVFKNFFVQHWEGHCSTTTTGNVATVTAGSNVITLSASPASLGLTTGLVASGTGANGVLPRSVIVGTYTSPNSIVISKAAQPYKASGVANFSGTVMTVTSTNYNNFAVGDTINGSGVTATTIASLGTASATQGGTGTYNLNASEPTLTGVAIDVPLTQTGTVPLTFSLDPSGVVCGLNGYNSGNTWDNLNSFEWTSSDSESVIAGDQYGFSLWVTSSCTNLNLGEAQLNEAVAPLFLDTNNSGSSFQSLSTYNSTWNTTEYNSPSIVAAIGSGTIQIVNWSTNAPAQIFIDNNSVPSIQIGGYIKTQSAPSINAVPNTAVQVWNASANVSAQNFDVDPFVYSAPSSIALLGESGPGSYGVNINTINLGNATLNNFLVNDEGVSTARTIQNSDCGSVIQINTANTASAFILPDTMTGAIAGSACQIGLFVNGTNATIQNAANGTINGVSDASPQALATNVYYSLSTAGYVGGYLNWGINPPLPGNMLPVAKTNSGGITLGQANIATGVILRSNTTANFTDTTATATQIEGTMSSLALNNGFRFRLDNSSSYTDTLAGGTGVTISGTATIAAGTWRDFQITASSIVAGSAAVTFTNIGGGNIN